METRRSSDSSQSAGPSGCSSSQTATKRSHPSPPDVARDIMASGTGATTSHGELAQAKRSPARAHQPSSATAAASGEGEDDGSLLHASDSHPEPGTLPAGKTGRKQKAVVQQPVKDPESGQLYRCLVIDYEQENESEKYPFITEKTVSAEALLTQLKLEENSLEKFGVTPVEDAVAHIVQSRKRVYLPCTESENGLESVKRSLRQKLIKNAFKFEIEDFANEEGFKDFIKKCAEKDKGDATWFAGVLAEASRDVDVSEVIDVPGHIERQLLLHDREALYGEIVTAIRQNHLDEMDKIRQAEPRQLKLLRQRLIQERLQFQSEQEAKARLAAQQQTQQQHGPMASLGVAAPAPSASIPGGLPPCSAGMGPTPPRGPLAAQTPIHGMTDAGMTVHPSALGFQTIVDSGTRTHDPQSFLSAHALQQHPPPVQPQFTASHRRDMDGAAARGPNFGMAMPEAVGVSFSRQTPVYESEEHAMRMSEGYPGMSVNLPAQQSPPFQPQFTESHWRDMGSAGAQEPNFGMAMPEAVGVSFSRQASVYESEEYAVRMSEGYPGMSVNLPQQQPPPFQPQFAALQQRGFGGAAAPGYFGPTQLCPSGMISVPAPMGGQPPAGYQAHFAGAERAGATFGIGTQDEGGQSGQMSQPHTVSPQPPPSIPPPPMQGQTYPVPQEGYSGVQPTLPQQRTAPMPSGESVYGPNVAAGQGPQQRPPLSYAAAVQLPASPHLSQPRSTAPAHSGPRATVPSPALQQPPRGHGHQSGRQPPPSAGHYRAGNPNAGQARGPSMPRGQGPAGAAVRGEGRAGQPDAQSSARETGMSMSTAVETRCPAVV